MLHSPLFLRVNACIILNLELIFLQLNYNMTRCGIFISSFLLALSCTTIECLLTGMPFPICFDPSTAVELANGKAIAVEDLRVGDEIVSCKSVANGNCGDRYIDHVTDVTVVEEGGPFPAHTFVFENQRQLNVTSPHIMYTYKESNGKLTPVTNAAMNVKVGDVMKFQDNSYSKVAQAIDFKLAQKVSVNTVGGSFYANGVLTTGLCENYQEDKLNISAETILRGYADSHEGINNCILAQKDLSMSPDVFAPACLSQLS